MAAARRYWCAAVASDEDLPTGFTYLPAKQVAQRTLRPAGRCTDSRDVVTTDGVLKERAGADRRRQSVTSRNRDARAPLWERNVSKHRKPTHSIRELRSPVDAGAVQVRASAALRMAAR